MSERAGHLLGLLPSLGVAWAAEREPLGSLWRPETLAAADPTRPWRGYA